MKKTAILGILAALVILSGCKTTTLSSMKPDSTLLLIPLTNEKDEGATPFGSYYAVISPIDSTEAVEDVRLNPSDEYNLEKRLPPGDYYISQTYFQYNGSGDIPDSERKFYDDDFASFTLEEGTLTLCPVIFSTTTSKGSGLKLPVTMDLTSYKDKGAKRGKELLRLLEAKYPGQFATWEIRE